MGYRFIKNNVLAIIFLGILNAQTVAVTFQVGMGNETVTNGVWLAGGDAQNPGFEMTDSNGDMIYSVTLDVPQDARYHYKFSSLQPFCCGSTSRDAANHRFCHPLRY